MRTPKLTRRALLWQGMGYSCTKRYWLLWEYR